MKINTTHLEDIENTIEFIEAKLRYMKGLSPDSEARELEAEKGYLVRACLDIAVLSDKILED